MSIYSSWKSIRFGWRHTEFSSDEALAIVQPYAEPLSQMPQLLFSFFTLEGKKGKEFDFFDNIYAVALGLVTESIELC